MDVYQGQAHDKAKNEDPADTWGKQERMQWKNGKWSTIEDGKKGEDAKDSWGKKRNDQWDQWNEWKGDQKAGDKKWDLDAKSRRRY